jgi:hypothetical protein
VLRINGCRKDKDWEAISLIMIGCLILGLDRKKFMILLQNLSLTVNDILKLLINSNIGVLDGFNGTIFAYG